MKKKIMIKTFIITLLISSMLISMERPPISRSKEEDLYVAVNFKRDMDARKAIWAGAKVDEFLNGETALMLAAQQSNPDLIDLLLQAQADPNLQHEITKGTALHFACQAGCIKAIQLLEAHGAHSDIKDKRGRVPRELLPKTK